MEDIQVDRRFADAVLRRLVSDPDFHPPGWGDREIADLRLLAQCARAATVRDDLTNMRLLRLKPLTGDGESVHATLGAGLEVLLTFDRAGGHEAVIFALPHAENGASR
jgi:hypothetical protein